MQSQAIRKVVIVGGGTAGWMTAAAMSHFFNEMPIEICLIESDQIGTVGVGEATLPHLRYFNQTLGIDESDFMRRTQATYKLGIEFAGWGKHGDAYIHPFGDYGFPLGGVDFHQHWLAQRKLGNSYPIDDYSLGVVAARNERFSQPSQDPCSLLSTFSYAFHIDASLYAGYLQEYSVAKGVTRVEGKVVEVSQQSETGFIQSVTLASGSVIEGELFIDCSGFSALLIEKTLKSGFEDWSAWLPCNRAVAVPSAGVNKPPPYTRATAKTAGWQWEIPLQHRTGNGQVYCNEFIDDDTVLRDLLDSIDGEPLCEPNFLRFQTGKRKSSWKKNCIAIGLSAGFLEPLESTSIYLIQIAIMKLIELFPDVHCASAERNEFNRLIDLEYERVKDFLILHYHATERNDSAFWDYCRTMPIPDSLQHKMELFREQGHVVEYESGLFLKPSWLAVYLGQGLIPRGEHPCASQLPDSIVKSELDRMRRLVREAAESMPEHQAVIENLHAKINTKPAPDARMSLYGVGV